MITNCIFDLDGTLLDTSEGIVESVRYAVRELGYEELPYETLLRFVGPPVQTSFRTFCGCSEKEAQDAANVFRDYYKEKALLKAVPYDGIFDLCRREMQADRENSVLVGDTINDAVGAERSGTKFIAVTYGFGFRTKEDAEKHPIIGVADTPLKIAKILLNERT